MKKITAEISPRFKVFMYSGLAVLALTGIVFSILLLIWHYYPAFGSQTFSCGAGCTELSSSDYSSVLGVPLPLYSLYFFVVILLFVAGFMLYGHESFNGFIVLMFCLYIMAAICSIILVSIMIYSGTFCSACLVTHIIVILSLAIVVLSAYRTGIAGKLKLDKINALKKRELRPALLYLFIVMILLVPALSYVDILVRTGFVKNRITADNAKKFAEELYKTEPAELSLPDSLMSCGNKNAKIKLVVFTDFMCSACYKNNEVISALIKKYPDDIYIQYYNYPLDHDCNGDIKITLYKNSCNLSKYMVIASQEGIFQELLDYYYKNYKEIKSAVKRDNNALLNKYLLSKGKILRPDVETEAKKIIERDIGLAHTLGLQSTPVIFLNGRKIDGSYPFEFLDRVIRDELK